MRWLFGFLLAACGDDSAVPDAQRSDAGASTMDSGEARDSEPARFDVVPFDAGERTPHPRFADLADNTALDLGAYDCRSRVPEEALRCELIVDYSRFNYDPYLHRILMFGGGHAATGRTDVDVFDLETLAWQSLYPSMMCSELETSAIDPRGFHVSTGHPVARHSYDMNVIADAGGVGRFLMLSTEGFAGYCHGYDSPIRSIAYLALTPGHTEWEYSEEFELPWYYAASAELDPISGMVVVIGSGRGASAGGMWIVDPASLEVVAFAEIDYEGIEQSLVFFPPNGKMYQFVDGSVWEVTLDREDWSRSTSTRLAASGPAGHQFAYDSRNAVILGPVIGDAIHVFDPATGAFTIHAMNVVSADGARPGNGVEHMLDYDPVDNVAIFLSGGPFDLRTWAYRFRR